MSRYTLAGRGQCGEEIAIAGVLAATFFCTKDWQHAGVHLISALDSDTLRDALALPRKKSARSKTRRTVAR